MTGRPISTEPLAQRTSRAMAMMTIQSITARIVMLGSNWALGLLLEQSAFGVSGMANIVGSTAWVFAGFCLDDVIVQRGRGLGVWEATTFRSSLAIACVAAIVTAAAAPFFGWLFHDQNVVGPILVFAVSLPIASLSTVAGAKLNARMEFPFMIQWGYFELIATQALIILFAFLGCKAYSFVLPMPIIMAARAIRYNFRAPPEPSRPHTGVRRLRLLQRGAMATGSKLIANLIAQGDYLVLALLTSTSSVGFYYFAFRLAAVPARTIATSLNTVLFPAMTAMNSDLRRMEQSAMKSANLLSWIVSPLSYFQIVLAAPLLHFFFGDKWSASILMIQFLSIGLAVEAIMAVTRAYLSAAGKFDVALKYSLWNGAGFFLSCIVGALAADAVGVALALSTYYIATQPAIFSFLVDHSGQRLKNIFHVFFLPTLASAGAFGASWLLIRLTPLPLDGLAGIVLMSILGWLVYFALFAILAPGILKALIGLLRSVLTRRKRNLAEAAG
jgi:PST family polysaccharide transporter